MYEVVGSSASRAFRVLWMLEELAIPYTHIPAAPQSAEARAVNPSGKIPVLRQNGGYISDSLAIMAYLADVTGKMSYPAGSFERARQDALTHRISDELDSALWVAARHSFVLPEELRVPEVKTTLRWEYERNLAFLENELAGPFLMGDQMTVPDIILTHCLRWARHARFPPPSGKLVDYLARMEAREPLQRAAALD
ncbi:MAG: glutathione S-transferase family protein [Pseudomonadota bacterium]